MTWTLYQGDCINGMASLADKSVDHVITDPPFDAEAHTRGRRRKGKGKCWGLGRQILEAPLSFPPLDEDVRVAAAAHFVRLARRWILVFCQIESAHLWIKAIQDAGGVYKRTCIWRKPDGQPQLTGDRPGMGYETFVACHAPGRSRWNGGGRHAVWTASKSERVSDHQTEKPLKLMSSLVNDFTDRDELILDPFAGSGTTGVAALHLGRRFVGWECDPKYAAVARQRLDGVREQRALDLDGGTDSGARAIKKRVGGIVANKLPGFGSGVIQET